MLNVNSQGLRSFNVYDVFANIVPGIISLLGMSFPFDIQGKITSNLVPVASVFIIVAFVFGQVIQALGSWADGDHGFSILIRDIINNRSNDRYNITEFDERFLLCCDNAFELTDDFNDYGRLFKMLLAYLEYGGRTRALRMQALYLFSRGIWVSLWVTTLWFVVIYISIKYGYLSNESLKPINLSMSIVRNKSGIGVASIFTFIMGLAFGRIRKHLEEDWIQYVIVEFCLDQFAIQDDQTGNRNLQI